jgi:hypothetical protein
MRRNLSHERRIGGRSQGDDQRAAPRRRRLAYEFRPVGPLKPLGMLIRGK